MVGLLELCLIRHGKFRGRAMGRAYDNLTPQKTLYNPHDRPSLLCKLFLNISFTFLSFHFPQHAIDLSIPCSKYGKPSDFPLAPGWATEVQV